MPSSASSRESSPELVEKPRSINEDTEDDEQLETTQHSDHSDNEKGGADTSDDEDDEQKKRPHSLNRRATESLQLTPSPWRRIVILFGIVGLLWLATLFLQPPAKPEIIYASRYSKEHKYRPAASPIITETLKDGRIRLRGANPTTHPAPTPTPPSAKKGGNLKRKSGSNKKRTGGTTQQRKTTRKQPTPKKRGPGGRV